MLPGFHTILSSLPPRMWVLNGHEQYSYVTSKLLHNYKSGLGPIGDRDISEEKNVMFIAEARDQVFMTTPYSFQGFWNILF